ncbi:MAG: right-handed parallel beta-helix repeat-containing protein [Acidimicrobiia bacterium]
MSRVCAALRLGGRRRAVGLLGITLALGSLVAMPARAHAEEESAEPPELAVITEEDAELQAAVLAAEDRRLTEIRTVTSLARWQGRNWKTPYRLGSAGGYTLVLTPRADAYTIQDLLELAPQTFLRMSDGSYLLTEHIIVMPRATLRLSRPGGLTLRLASSHDGFATIVSLGGELELIGEQGAVVHVTSWDATLGAVDELTTDGRAYIRAIGGQFDAKYVAIAHLGFWSGRTGGVALTGTDRPNTGAIESIGSDVLPDDRPTTLLDGVTLQPAGPLEDGQNNTTFGYTVPELDYVSSRISNLTVEHDAYGLFVSGANGIQVTDSTFSDNQLGGVVFHRFVTNGVISRTTSSHNVGDGFSLARATTGIVISESIATRNSGSGFSIDSRSLADGASAMGASLRDYGNNSISNSTATDNGHYGIEVLGGFNLGVQNNVVEGHDMGILVRGPADRLSVTGNTVDHSRRHGIALVDGVAHSAVTGNVVDGSSTGVYIRDSSAQVKGNTIQAAFSHGVSLVGQVDGSEVSYNVLAGSGASAFDARRSHGDVAAEANNTDGWHDTTPWYYVFRKLLHPTSLLWCVLAILILVSAIRSKRSNGVIEHPYAHQMAHRGHMPIPVPAHMSNGSGELL